MLSGRQPTSSNRDVSLPDARRAEDERVHLPLQKAQRASAACKRSVRSSARHPGSSSGWKEQSNSETVLQYERPEESPGILSSLALVRTPSVIISATGHLCTGSPLDHLLVEGQRAAVNFLLGGAPSTSASGTESLAGTGTIKDLPGARNPAGAGGSKARQGAGILPAGGSETCDRCVC